MNYATTIDETKEWGVLQRRVAVFCKEDRVKGVELLGRTWFIPKEEKNDLPTQIRKDERRKQK